LIVHNRPVCSISFFDTTMNGVPTAEQNSFSVIGVVMAIGSFRVV